MNLDIYISSGILEQYVLGDLSLEDQKQVEQYAKQFPAIKKELDNIEDTLLDLATNLSERVPISEDDIISIIDKYEISNNSNISLKNSKT